MKYNGIKNETIDLNEIDRKDLLKIRKLFLAEAKLQNEKLEDEIDILDMLKMVSWISMYKYNKVHDNGYNSQLFLYFQFLNNNYF